MRDANRTGYSSIGRALGSGPRGSQFKPEYPDHFLTSLHLRVRGRVQGVGFRYAAWKIAREAGLAGWVRNREDGTAEAEVEGDAEAVARFIQALKDGCPAARVDAIETREIKPRGRKDFEIRG